MKLNFSFGSQALLLAASALSQSLIAATPGDLPAAAQTDLAILERARDANADVYSALQSFVCNEEMNRFRGDLAGQYARPLGTVKAKLSFERGVEQYTEVFDDNRPRPAMSSLTGAWSQGEFGTLLLQTQQLLSTQPVNFENFVSLNGEQAAMYRFDVPAEESPWSLTVAGRSYALPFSTSVWVSIKTGEILKIDRNSLRLAPETHISEIQWSITLDHVVINGAKWLLPVTGAYSVLYHNTNRREFNLISFTGYRRYAAETALKFD